MIAEMRGCCKHLVVIACILYNVTADMKLNYNGY